MNPQHSRDLEAIDGLRRGHVAAVERGDVGWLVAAFAEDGMQMPPHAPANVGRQAIRSWLQGLFGAFEVGFTLSVDEVRVAGEWAFERGAYGIALTPKSDPAVEPMREAGKYITIYSRRPGGGWEIARDIWNGDAPPPGPS
jgi:ketosteroid isomerase-like protein